MVLVAAVPLRRAGAVGDHGVVDGLLALVVLDDLELDLELAGSRCRRIV
jgi:hypothetical protein